MILKYFYPNKSFIYVSNDIYKRYPHTFLPNGKLWEWNTLQSFLRILDFLSAENNKVTVVDIGCQVGLYSLCSKFYTSSFFHSFDVNNKAIIDLKSLQALNSISNNYSYNIALSNTNGIKYFYFNRNHNGLHFVSDYYDSSKESDHEISSITTHTLDFYNLNPNFIKCDCEGHELFIFKGSIDTISKFQPIIQLEFQKSRMMNLRVTPTQIRELFYDLDYAQIPIPTDPGEILVAPKNRIRDILLFLNTSKFTYDYKFTLTNKIRNLFSKKL